jgi:hypothetical protein
MVAWLRRLLTAESGMDCVNDAMTPDVSWWTRSELLVPTKPVRIWPSPAKGSPEGRAIDVSPGRRSVGMDSAMVVPGSAILATGTVACAAGVDRGGMLAETLTGGSEVNGNDHEGKDMARTDTDGNEAEGRETSADGGKEGSEPWLG